MTEARIPKRNSRFLVTPVDPAEFTQTSDPPSNVLVNGSNFADASIPFDILKQAETPDKFPENEISPDLARLEQSNSSIQQLYSQVIHLKEEEKKRYDTLVETVRMLSSRVSAQNKKIEMLEELVTKNHLKILQNSDTVKKFKNISS
ncbi:uncharacterized protein LOC135139873 [Zophobas morio]|uniref:uncharacterized protein LOC135139873 n=1 Tax=Zophobas morio TaxID=2755281 RepID=UPI003083314E